MTDRIDDTTKVFDIYDAQTSFHNLLIKYGFREPILGNILQVHLEYLKTCFEGVEVKGAWDNRCFEIHAIDIEKNIKYTSSRRIADQIMDKVKLTIHKGPFETQYATGCFLMMNRIKYEQVKDHHQGSKP